MNVGGFGRGLCEMETAAVRPYTVSAKLDDPLGSGHINDASVERDCFR